MKPVGDGGRRPRVLLGALTFLAVAGFMALGIWQLERRAWKLELIERVEARLQEAPVAAPGPSDWARLSKDADEYRRVHLTGRFLNDRETLVKAVTDLGAGVWVLTPFETRSGFTVLVNRGFAPSDKRDANNRQAGVIEGETSVNGLLRLSEPGGGFLRSNAPDEDRWYSRDVAAIAAARGLDNPAPYFVDADATPNAGGYPVGGLTAVRFRNSHLVYALTWFALALLGGWIALREDRRIARRILGAAKAH